MENKLINTNMIHQLYEYDLYNKLMNISTSFNDPDIYELFENYDEDELIYIVKNYKKYDLDNVDIKFIKSSNKETILDIIETLLDLYKFYLFRSDMLENIDQDFFPELDDMIYSQTGKHILEQGIDEIIQSLIFTYIYIYEFISS